jgi:HEAT repeat protein
MNAPAPRLDARPAPDLPPPEEREAVQELVRDLGRSLRVHLLYEGNNTAVGRFVEALQARFAAVWELLPRVAVHVEEREIGWQGETVYRGETRAEDLAFLLYRDGVRELTFLPGFEGAELAAFLDILVRVQRLKADEDDLLTLLWDRDWKHLRYRYVEALPDGVALPAPSASPARAVPPPREEESTLVSTVSREDFREALYFLDEADLRRLDAEVRREQERDLWRDVLSGLFDRLEDGTPERQERIVGILADLLPTLLAAGNLPLAAGLLRELVAIATRPGVLAPPVLRAVRGLFDRLSHAETVEELIRTVEHDPGPAALEGLGALLSFFPPDTLPALLRAAEATSAEGVRAAVLDAAERLAGGEGERLVPLLAHEDARVAAGAARVAGRRGMAAAAPAVARQLARPELPLRLAAVEALLALRNPVAAHALQGALGDGEREVRIAAARALAALRYSPARAALEAALGSRRLAEADRTERIAFYEAFGAVAGEDGVGLLDRVLNGKSWLGRKESAETRACAALGLARSGLPSARRALASASAETDPVVRSAVGRALRGMES